MIYWSPQHRQEKVYTKFSSVIVEGELDFLQGE